MEFPFGHHHRRRSDEEDDRERPSYPPPSTTDFSHPPPPRPSYYPDNVFEPPAPVTHAPGFHQQEPDSFRYQPRPPTQVTHVHHSGGYPPESGYHNYPPHTEPTHGYHHSGDHRPGYHTYAPPPETEVIHVTHQGNPESYRPEAETHSSFRPHLPSFLHQHTHQSGGDGLSSRPTVRVFCKANSDYSLTIRDGKVILARSDPSDEYQHWIKDEKFSTRVKDEEGFPSFALVNKATGEAMKHSTGDTHPVQLIPYNPNGFDESVLWSMSRDFGDDFRTIRMINNIRLNVDAFHGDKRSGGVHDGTTIVLWKWNKGDNQLWKIRPFVE